MAESNFQDAVVLASDTLSFRGEQLVVGTGAGTKSVVFSNTQGALHLAAAPTATETIYLPDTSGTLAVLSNIGITGISAGTTRITSGEAVFSNSNNVSFGVNGNTVTASVTVASTQASINFSAGTTSNLASAITFSNSNGVSFGLNASTITASIATSLTNINVSAGTTSNNLSAITFSNSNGVSFGLNGSTLTGSHAINLSAGTTSNNLSAVTFSNSNNVSFGLNGSTITASATVASTQASINLSAGTTSNLASAFTFSNSNGVSFGLNASTITASIATSLTNINVSAGTTSNNLSAVVFSNSNGVSFGLNGSTITATVTPGAAAGIAAVSAGTQSQSSGTLVFSNSNGVTFGMSNSSVITASVATSLTNINVSAGTTSNNLSAVTFSNSNAVSFGLNGSTVTASCGNTFGISAGTQSVSTGAPVFSNSNGITFGMSGSSQITASMDAVRRISGAQGTTFATGSQVNFDGNGINFSVNGQTVVAEPKRESFWENMNGVGLAANSAATNSGAINMSLQRISFANPIFATRLDFIGHLTVVGSTAGSTTMSFAVYSQNGSTLTRLNSASGAHSWNSGGATSNISSYSGVSGTRIRSMSLATWDFAAAGDYWVAFINSVNGPSGTTGSMTIYGESAVSLNAMPGGGNDTVGAQGLYSAATGAFPASIHITAINYTGAGVNAQPYFRLFGTF